LSSQLKGYTAMLRKKSSCRDAMKILAIVGTVLFVMSFITGCTLNFEENKMAVGKGLTLDSGFVDHTLYSETPLVGLICPASICMYEGDIIVASYGNLARIDLQSSGNTSYFEAISDVVWNPTGLYYDEENDLLYIANYTGHNVFVCKIKDDGNLELIREFTHPEMQSPENVSVTSDGKKVAVADTDGGAVYLFDQTGNVLWKNELSQAHGVTTDDRHVYASSLFDRTIVKYDMNGKEVARVGALSALEGQDAYVWPVCVYAYGNSILITDAHTGRITQRDKDLNYITSIGANGPSVNTFNMCYSVIVHDGFLYFADTYNFRIIKTDLSGTMLETYSYKYEPNIPSAEYTDVVQRSYENMPYTYGVLNDVPAELFGYDSNDFMVLNVYTGVEVFSREGVRVKHCPIRDKEVDYSALEFPHPAFPLTYIMWGHALEYNGKQYYIFGSSQHGYAFYVYNATDNLFFTTAIYTKDLYRGDFLSVWKIDDQLYSRYGQDTEDTLAQKVLGGISETEDAFNRLVDGGMTRQDAYIKAFTPYYNKKYWRDMDETEFEQWLELTISTEEGKKAWDNLRTGTPGGTVWSEYSEAGEASDIMYMKEYFWLRTFCGK
jgi:DNA-binding beta-propeller fold protein YncE